MLFMPRLAWLVVWVALAAAPAPIADPPDPCALCAGSKQVTCPTCSGRGRGSPECAVCRGDGKMACTYCKLSDAVMAKLPVKPKRGWLPCPNRYCTKGMVKWKSSSQDPKKETPSDPCKVCDAKGTSKCPVCSEGMAPCIFCGGKGRAPGACGDCAGSGKLECPGCTARATGRSCQFCHNAKKRECELCKPGRKPVESGAKVKCAACAGAGATLCDECEGFGRMTCDPCGGTGRIRKEIVGTGEKAGKNTDDYCKGTGWRKCESCKAGKRDCPNCQNGEVDVKCGGCRDTKLIRCHGCFPWPWTSFEVFGRMLHAAGRFDDARAFYATALKRVSDAAVEVENERNSDVKRIGDLLVKEARSRIEGASAAAAEQKPLSGAK